MPSPAETAQAAGSSSHAGFMSQGDPPATVDGPAQGLSAQQHSPATATVTTRRGYGVVRTGKAASCNDATAAGRTAHTDGGATSMAARRCQVH